MTVIRYSSDAMREQTKTGYNLVIFQYLFTGSDTLGIIEGKKVVESSPK